MRALLALCRGRGLRGQNRIATLALLLPQPSASAQRKKRTHQTGEGIAVQRPRVARAESDRDAGAPPAAPHLRRATAPRPGANATPRSKPTRTEKCARARDPPCDAESAAQTDPPLSNSGKLAPLPPGSCSSAPSLPPKAVRPA